jgi:hypothetical protein
MGVEGLEAEAGSRLRRWDPNHYGSLHIPGDGFSYDIFAQVSRALVSSRWRTGADPLAGLSVKHCIGTGQSQFAARLATYVSAMHPVTNFFSGVLSTLTRNTSAGDVSCPGSLISGPGRRLACRAPPSG